MLEVTQDCNFKCVYCPRCGNLYSNQRNSNKKLSNKLAFLSIDYFLNEIRHIKSNISPRISFYGGEPLLQKGLIQDCMSYARRIRPNVQFSIQTNGYFLDETFLNCVKKYNASLGVSLDGSKRIHDQYRTLPSGSGTFDRVFSNILKISEMDFDYVSKNVSILLTLTSTKNVDEIKEFIDKYPILRKVRIETNFVNYIGFKNKIKRPFEVILYNDPKYADYLISARNRYINMYKSKKWKNLNLEHSLFYKDLSIIINRKPIKGPNFHFERLCPPGKWRLFVDVDGNIRICEKTDNLPIVGNIKNGIDWDLIKKMEEDFLATCSSCYSCWAIGLCKICWNHIYDKHGKVNQLIKDRYCNIVKTKMPYALELFVEITDNNPKAFEIIPI